MGRPKAESIYNNWNEVDKAMKKLGELRIKKRKLEGELTIKINELKGEYNDKGATTTAEIKNIEKEINRFCEQNKETFIKKRSKKLVYGSVSYRLTRKISINNIESAISALTVLNMDWCLRKKFELDKDELMKLDTNTLTKIGATIIPEDKLTIEPNIEEIAANIQKDED